MPNVVMKRLKGMKIMNHNLKWAEINQLINTEQLNNINKLQTITGVSEI